MELNRTGALSWAEVLRRWPVVLLAVLLCSVAGVAVGLRQGNTYTSTTTLIVNPLDGSPFSPGERGQNLANLRTEAQLIASDSVAEIARRSLRTTAGTSTLAGHVSVVNPANTQVLEVSFADSTPDSARAGSQAFADAYLTFRERRAADTAQARIDRLETAITTNEAVLGRATAALAGTRAGTPANALALQKVQAATDELSKLENQVGDLRLFPTDPGQVLSPATAPAAPSGLPMWAYPAGGAVLGLLLGVAWAAVLAVRDDRLRDADDIEERGFPVLGTVAVPPPTPGLLADPAAPLPDDVRVLRTVLAATAPRPCALVLAGMSPGAADTTWLSLAAALARAGSRVTLVDAGGGSLTRLAGEEDGRQGLSDVLAGDTDPVLALRRPQPRLTFLTAGSRPADASDLLLSPRARDLVAELTNTADWVLLAATEAGNPDALGLAGVAGRVVLAVVPGATTASQLGRTAAEIVRCGAELVGVVVLEPARRRTAERPPERAAIAPAPTAALPAEPIQASAVDDRSA
jgi:capsular polysaccharide biosynthesis protein/Mrp family chromosome partitioning ATPase